MEFIVNDTINFSNNCKIDNDNYVGSIEMFYSRIPKLIFASHALP